VPRPVRDVVRERQAGLLALLVGEDRSGNDCAFVARGGIADGKDDR
jgi:hypothetical protein